MTQLSRFSQRLALFGWFLAVFAAAALGAIASADAPTFYGQLSKPSWAPPAGVFGPVWTVLYCLMAISVWLAWRTRPGHKVIALFCVQLAVNALWSWLFFAWHQGALAFAGVVLLLALIAATMRAFWRSSRIAAMLLAPYLLWVGFATALTWAVWQRNPALL